MNTHTINGQEYRFVEDKLGAGGYCMHQRTGVLCSVKEGMECKHPDYPKRDASGDIPNGAVKLLYCSEHQGIFVDEATLVRHTAILLEGSS